MMQITEDTPPDMLAGAMDLTVYLPTGRVVKISVERSTPMMDVLVQITTAHHLQHSGHILQALATASTTGQADKVLPYKPNFPIGVLDIQHVRVVPKNRPSSVVKNSTTGYQQPFESTFRLQVHLPRNQLYVIRVSQNVYLSDIMRKVCNEKKLDMLKYEFRHPGNLEEVLDLKFTLSDYQVTEVYLVAKGTFGLTQTFSTNDIMALRKEEERRQLQARTGSGVFNLIFKRGKTSVGTGSLSSENRSISPSHSDDSRSITPPVVNMKIMPQVTHDLVDKPKPPLRKRRPAPKPPQCIEELQKNSTEKVATEVNNKSDISEPDSKEKKSDNGLTICHSRNSSDSSGYHEPSVLSDHCNTSLPRRTKGSVNEVFNQEVVSENISKLNGNLSNMANISKSSASIAGRKKKSAPLPPPLAVSKIDSVGTAPNKASPVVNASNTPSCEKEVDLPRLQPRTKKLLHAPIPTPRQKYILVNENLNMCEELSNNTIHKLENSNRETHKNSLIDHSGISPSITVSNLSQTDLQTNQESSEVISAELRDRIEIIEHFNVPDGMKKWKSLSALDMGKSSSFVHVESILVVGANNFAGFGSPPSMNAKVSLKRLSLQEDTQTYKANVESLKTPNSDTSLNHNNNNHIKELKTTIKTIEPHEVTSTCTLNNDVVHNVSSTENDEPINCETPVSYNTQIDETSVDVTPSVETFSNNVPNIPLQQIETDLTRNQSVDKIIEDESILDWEYQIPPPPTEFRDSSPIGQRKEVDHTLIEQPNYLDKSDNVRIDECQKTNDINTSSMLNTLTLENLEKRKSLVYNREISTSLKIAQENNNNDIDTNDILHKRSSMLNELEGVIQKGTTKTLTRHTEPPLTEHHLPNFKISTYERAAKPKLHIYEDDSIRSKSEEIINTDDFLFKKPLDFSKSKGSSRSNFYVKRQLSSNVMRSESFSSKALDWKPLNPVQRSKSQVALNKSSDDSDKKTDINNLTKSSSLFDVSGLQSLEVMRVIQNRLNTPSNSVEQLEEGTFKQTNTTTNSFISETFIEDTTSKMLPPKVTESATTTKTYQYQGPPVINLSTWSERPKTKISLKEDTDYRISTKDNRSTIVKINGNQSIITEESGNTTIKIGDTKSKSSADFLSRMVNYRKPLGTVNKIDKVTRPHSVAYESDFDISRVPIVRAVELKKSVTQITNNDNNIFSDVYNSSSFSTIGNRQRTSEIKPLQRVNSYAQNHPQVLGFRGIEMGNDNTARSRKSWNVPNSYSTLPSKVDLIEPPSKSNHFTPNSNVPFSQLSLKRVESTKTTNVMLRNTLPHSSNNVGSRFSTGSSFLTKSESLPSPPPMPQVQPQPVRSVSYNENSVDPRDNLLNSIRNFGGLKGFKHTKV